MAKKNKERKNIVFVTIFIGTMLLFMFGTVVYVTSQVANCSSVKKARKVCGAPIPTISAISEKVT